jgi:hypothetical protein
VKGATTTSQQKTGEYIVSIPVVEPDDASVLDSEKMWEILHYVHERPLGVRPAEVAKEFDIRINQAYDKLRKLERAGYLVHQKRRGKPGKEAERKTLLYFSRPWGYTQLNADFENDVLRKKYGKLVMEAVKPSLVGFFKQVLEDLKKNPDLKKWYPSPQENLCLECGMQHQALELFYALAAFAAEVTSDESYDMYQVLLDNGYITQKKFKEYTTRSGDDEQWVLSDNTPRA